MNIRDFLNVLYGPAYADKSEGGGGFFYISEVREPFQSIRNVFLSNLPLKMSKTVNCEPKPRGEWTNDLEAFKKRHADNAAKKELNKMYDEVKDKMVIEHNSS